MTNLTKLADFEPIRETVSSGKMSISVRGLSLVDISQILATHGDDLDSLLELYDQYGDGQFTNIAFGRYITNLLTDGPALVAHAIALAMDEPELVERAQRLPLGLQLEAAKTIGRLTLVEVGGVKKLFEMLRNVAANLSPAPTQDDGQQ